MHARSQARARPLCLAAHSAVSLGPAVLPEEPGLGAGAVQTGAAPLTSAPSSQSEA